jgi:carboxylesterase type B
MAKVVVIGAGCAGIAAAAGARKAGAEVALPERQDQLLGIGRIAGSMDVGGRYPLHLEAVEMGAGEVNKVLDDVSLDNMDNYAGQSSGSMATRWLLGCGPAKGLFQHAIAQSGGGTWDIDPILPFEDKCVHSQRVLDMVGWTLGDVLTRDAYEVCSTLDAIVPNLGLPKKSLRARLLQPSVDNWLISDYYGNLIFDGASADVDIMVGSIRDEWQNYNCQVSNRIDGWEYEFAIAHSIAWGRRNNMLGRKPVYTYFFDHDIPDENGKPTKPMHNGEMPYTFGTYERFPNKWTEYDRRLSETTVDYWTSFAKTGDPNTPGRALWLPYTPEHPVTMTFTNDGWGAVHLDGREKLDKVVKFLLERPGILDRPFPR